MCGEDALVKCAGVSWVAVVGMDYPQGGCFDPWVPSAALTPSPARLRQGEAAFVRGSMARYGAGCMGRDWPPDMPGLATAVH
jgi:hypothetical protein